MRSIEGPPGWLTQPRRRTFVRLLGFGGTLAAPALAIGNAGRPTSAASSAPVASPADPAAGRGVAVAAGSRWFTTSDGVRLHYLEAGPGAGNADTGSSAAPTIALVPGWSMPGWIWQAQIEHFSTQCRVLALDPRGQGRSQVAPEGYTYARRGTDIGEWLAAARCTAPVVLVGWSLGVLESLQYLHDVRTTAAPTPVRALALVDNSVGVGDPPTSDPTFFTRLRTKRRETVGGFVNAMFKRPVDPVWRDALVEAALRLPLAASIDLLRQPRPREFWRDSLLATSMPVLYAYTPRFAQQGDIMKTRRPATQTQLFAEAGHALFVDEAATFNARLEQFVQRATERPAGNPPR